jgi:hypothetical protein
MAFMKVSKSVPPDEIASDLGMSPCYPRRSGSFNVWLARLNQFLENIRVAPLVVAKREFRQVERQIILADLMICADHATLEQRPEGFYRIRVHNAPDVLACFVVHDFVPIACISEVLYAPAESVETSSTLSDTTLRTKSLARPSDVSSII